MPTEIIIAAGNIHIDAPRSTKRLEKGSALTHQEGDDNLDRAHRTYVISVISESGVSDDLASISGAFIDDVVLLLAAPGHTLTVKHNVVNLKLLDGADFDLHGNRILTLLKTVAEFSEVSRSNNV